MVKNENFLCICSHCGKVFKFHDLKIVDRPLFHGISIKESRCPQCGSMGYTAVKDMNYFDKKMIKEQQ